MESFHLYNTHSEKIEDIIVWVHSNDYENILSSHER